MKILVAQLNLVIGDLAGNFAKIKETITKAKNHNEDTVVFPELALTGYPPNDLLLRKGFVDEQLSYLEEVKRLTTESDLHVFIGAVTKNDGVGKPLRNAALVFSRGVEIFRYHKQLLPTYNVFDENRYFEAGSADQNNVLTVLRDNGKHWQVGVLICEDCWNDEAICDVPLYPTNPVKKTFREGFKANDSSNPCSTPISEVSVERMFKGDPNIVITLNASPSDIGKHNLRYQMYTALSKKYKAAFVYANSVGAQDALIFDGHSFMVEGDHIYYAKGFEEHLWSIFIDGGKPHAPLHPPICVREHLIFEHLKLGIRDYVRKNGFSQVVVGSSGGIDSAVVLMLAVEALGPQNVFAITMPSKFSSAGSVDDSVELCDMLGIKLYTRPIVNDVLLSIEEYKKAFGEDPKRIMIENMQARQRGRVLMEFSNQTGALVLSTGNKSEMSVGYCTIYGDMCGGLSVIADLYKMEVYALAKWYNDQKGESIIPKNIVDKAPSAELWEGQKDTDSLPPYPVLDALLKLYLERDLLNRKEVEEATAAIENMSLKEIKRILSMTDRAEFKRQQAAPVLRVHKRAFGFGRTLPITQRYAVSYENVL